MRHIQTVTGPVKPDSLYYCQCHEHLMISKGTSCLINKNLCIDDYEKTKEELEVFKEAGGTTIVDAQPVGCSRMSEALLQLGLDTKLQIIASTGFHKMIFYPNDHWIFQYDKTEISEVFLHELKIGMFRNCDHDAPYKYVSARAGIIKCALDTSGLNPQYQKLFDAAVSAAQKTMTPMMVHIEKGSDPLMLAHYLKDKNMNLQKVIFCHMDRAITDLTVHKELCRLGIYLEYDTIGRFKYHDNEREACIFSEMIQSGYEDRLLFSLDTTRERLKSYNPAGVGLTYILDTFIPILKSHGITDTQIDKISRLNCRQVLSIPECV